MHYKDWGLSGGLGSRLSVNVVDLWHDYTSGIYVCVKYGSYVNNIFGVRAIMLSRSGGSNVNMIISHFVR